MGASNTHSFEVEFERRGDGKVRGPSLRVPYPQVLKCPVASRDLKPQTWLESRYFIKDLDLSGMPLDQSPSLHGSLLPAPFQSTRMNFLRASLLLLTCNWFPGEISFLSLPSGV